MAFLSSEADKDDYADTRLYIHNSLEAQKEFTAFLAEHNSPSRYELIQFRASVKPLVVKAERALSE